LRPDADDDTVARAAALVDEAGGRAWATDEAQRRLDRASDALTGFELDPAAVGSLLQLAHYVTARDR
jgi:geranylgeranyl diphosphate synthase type I